MTGSRHAFGAFEVDEKLYELRRDGRVVPIEPKVFDVVVYLLHHRDRVVPKEELLQELWPPSVSASVLPRCVQAARRTLGDDAEQQRIIQTVRGRGYRFVAELQTSGRDRIARDLQEAWELARDGRGQVVGVVGPASSGKTSVVEGLLGDLPDGTRVVRGRGVSRADRPDFWPWIQILRTCVEQLTAADPDAPLPDLSLPDLSTSGVAPADLGPEAPQARFRLHDAVSRFLRSLAGRWPLVVVLEDAQWVDDESLGLLRHLATDIETTRLLLVLTARPEGRLQPTWEELEREPNFVRRELDSDPGSVSDE